MNRNNQEIKLTGKLKWVEQISYLLDERFRIPGTTFRFGLDPILNLIPAAGGLSGFVLTAALILTMAKNGASGRIVALMGINALLDATIGAIPVIGTVFDFFYKANSKNIRLLKEHYEEGKHQGSGKSVWITAIAVILVLFVLLLILLWNILEWIIGWF
ncbi:DUF4112 domain-containing protein [Paradesertivirga mongoliensis]|uniref:DUF4112 domain-containing protein n=1 Tax=Paradesertivirga mongoliensis TaxID=2100740 RepID=A0ABW4ZJ12_9SPHI|nr:DUF4112 domain-containing protein [Pedobacter mongoliensis]